jgi:hypothetical protein
MPYKGVKCDKMNISAMKNGKDHDLRVTCFSDACEYPDVYDFTYYGASKQLIQNRYVLEAIPPSERAMAISVALQNEEAANLMRTNSLESVTPTVRRVLPETEEAANLMRTNSLESVTPAVRRVLPGTAEKFYLPKTLLSVTWTRFGEKPVVVSVLVDPDEKKAVEVWSNLEVENKGGERGKNE